MTGARTRTPAIRLIKVELRLSTLKNQLQSYMYKFCNGGGILVLIHKYEYHLTEREFIGKQEYGVQKENLGGVSAILHLSKKKNPFRCYPY